MLLCVVVVAAVSRCLDAEKHPGLSYPTPPCCCRDIRNHPGLSIQHLLLSEPLFFNTLDEANFRGHTPTHLEKVSTKNK